MSIFKPGEKHNNPLPNYEPYSLQKVLDDLKIIGLSEKEATIPDLKSEVSILKGEIQ